MQERYIVYIVEIRHEEMLRYETRHEEMLRYETRHIKYIYCTYIYVEMLSYSL